jgi:hypothetical protein
MSQMVNVSIESNAVAWVYHINGVVLSVIGLAVWVTANIIRFPPPPSD